ncbi:MAG: GNAT family N-acetyltransferase [Chloroflexi bacterium]|nr:GNAT family N-acetyltransferase [Chloroflexota bacterium]
MVTLKNASEYPKVVVLRDQTKIDIRPMEVEDKPRLLRFFQHIPEDERHYLKENVTSPEVIHAWTEHMDLERVIPMVAVVEGEIVADGTLHRSRADARRHIGEIRLVVAPEYREKGLGGRMLRELVDLAVERGMHKVLMELVDRRERPAIMAAKGLGFTEVAVLQGAIKDYWGNLQDLVIMELPLEERDLWWRF